MKNNEKNKIANLKRDILPINKEIDNEKLEEFKSILNGGIEEKEEKKTFNLESVEDTNINRLNEENPNKGKVPFKD